MIPEFTEFPKIYRWTRELIITEKIDGTNAQVFIGDDGLIVAGSRTRWLPGEQGQLRLPCMGRGECRGADKARPWAPLRRVVGLRHPARLWAREGGEAILSLQHYALGRSQRPPVVLRGCSCDPVRA